MSEKFPILKQAGAVDVLTASKYPVFCCPHCKGSLRCGEEEYLCPACARQYPIVLGFPDFCVRHDQPTPYQDDLERAEFLLEQSDNLDFKGLIRLHYSTRLRVSNDRAERFMKRAFALVEKGVETLREIEEMSEKRHWNRIDSNDVLEIGCGSGGFLAAAIRKFKRTVGIDTSLPWLVLARKRLNELGLAVPLIRASAEYLPFEDGSFDLVVAEDVIEHVKDQEATLGECRRVLKRDGILFLATPNRFSIAREPHVRVWGVGFLPRRWMNKYVRLVRGLPYERYRLLSFFELKKLLRKCGFQDHEILLPRITGSEIEGFSIFERIQAAIYDVVRKMPFIRGFLYVIGPFFHVICYANKGHDRSDERTTPSEKRTEGEEDF